MAPMSLSTFRRHVDMSASIRRGYSFHTIGEEELQLPRSLAQTVCNNCTDQWRITNYAALQGLARSLWRWSSVDPSFFHLRIPHAAENQVCIEATNILMVSTLTWLLLICRIWFEDAGNVQECLWRLLQCNLGRQDILLNLVPTPLCPLCIGMSPKRCITRKHNTKLKGAFASYICCLFSAFWLEQHLMYPDLRSDVENHWAPAMVSRKTSILGSHLSLWCHSTSDSRYRTSAPLSFFHNNYIRCPRTLSQLYYSLFHHHLGLFP